MRKYSFALWLLIISPAMVHAGSEYLIKQRAKDLRDQNNARQGVAPAQPARPAPPQAQPQPAPAQPPVTLSAQQINLVRLQEDLSAMRPGTQITSEMKERLARDLIAAAQGAKPSPAAASKFAEEISAVLSQKLLSNVTRNHLVQNLNNILNPANAQKPQLQDAISEIQTIFKNNGVAESDAARVADAAKGLGAGLQKTAAK